jgi:hypothetical protein
MMKMARMSRSVVETDAENSGDCEKMVGPEAPEELAGWLMHVIKYFVLQGVHTN